MLSLFLLLFAGYVAGLLLPLCFPAKPRIQNILAHGCRVWPVGGILLGIGLFAPEPWTISVQSTIPFLSFAVRLDPLASFFVLTISSGWPGRFDLCVRLRDRILWAGLDRSALGRFSTGFSSR